MGSQTAVRSSALRPEYYSYKENFVLNNSPDGLCNTSYSGVLQVTHTNILDDGPLFQKYVEFT
jgi:hypothetical protein